MDKFAEERDGQGAGYWRRGESDVQMERYWLWLCSCKGLYRTQISGLMSYFRSPKQLYESDARELSAWKKLGNADTTAWVNRLIDYKNSVSLNEAEEKLSNAKIHFASRNSPAFPQKLRNLPDCPCGLFYLGSLPAEGRPSVAVVGARRCSNYGSQMARILGEKLASEGYQVISGMAAGVDGLAQAACISEGGRTFAVLGSGPDVCYPSESRRLYESIPEHGGVISEYPPGSEPLRYHFPNRNRLISGISDAVVVVEARERSGSLITADLALDQGKEVYAVPGRYTDVLSYGCNRLIEQGAGIVLSPENLLENLAVCLNLKRVRRADEDDRKARVSEGLDEDEKKVYAALKFEARGIDELAGETGLTLLQAMRALLSLQLKDHAVEVTKNRFAIRIAS